MAARKRKFGRYRRFSPKKGTKTRKFLLLALRPEGVSKLELKELGLGKLASGGLHRKMEDEYGYDIELVTYGTHKEPSRFFLRGRFYDKYNKQKSFNISNEEIEKAKKSKTLTVQDARRLKLLREINS